MEGPYVQGKKHGVWVTRHSKGYKSKGEYKNGQKEGMWLEYFRDHDRYDYESCKSRKYRKGDAVHSEKLNKKKCRQ